MKEIENREDVSRIVRNFYAKARTDASLSHFFNSSITDWEAHLEKLTDFWTMQLFGGKIYNGNPIRVHQEADDRSNHEVTAYHFGTWLNLWFATIDAGFTGENADILKRRARKMQTVLMVSIYENRK
jgi:hemoglobin